MKPEKEDKPKERRYLKRLPIKKKPKKRKSPKRISLAKAKAECWKAFSLLTKLRYSDDGVYVKCYTCSSILIIGTKNCQGGHMFPKKAFPAVYFNENNVRPQCARCNLFMEGNTVEFVKQMVLEIGQEEFDNVYALRHSQVKLTVHEYQEMTKRFEDQILILKQKHGILPR